MQARLATAVILGFVLVGAAACGGSDGLSTAEEEALQERLEAAEREAAEAELEAAEAERQRQEAEAEAEQARQDAQDAADAEAARQAAEEARQQAQQQLEQAQQESEELQQQLTEAEQAELRARASSFGAQLDLGDGTAGPNAPTTVSADATVTWPRDGSLTFRPSGVTHTRGSAAPSVPGGWTNTASFTGQTGTASTTLTDETVYLYTNIQRAGTRAFWKKYGGMTLT